MDKLWIDVKLWHFAVGGNANVLGNFRFGTLSEKFFTFTRSYVINYQLFYFVCLQILFRVEGDMVFNATFNNISAISWQSVLLVEETAVPGENHRPAVSH